MSWKQRVIYSYMRSVTECSWSFVPRASACKANRLRTSSYHLMNENGLTKSFFFTQLDSNIVTSFCLCWCFKLKSVSAVDNFRYFGILCIIHLDRWLISKYICTHLLLGAVRSGRSAQLRVKVAQTQIVLYTWRRAWKWTLYPGYLRSVKIKYFENIRTLWIYT